MKVKNKVNNEIVEMSSALYERNKKFFIKVEEEIKPKKVSKKKKNIEVQVDENKIGELE